MTAEMCREGNGDSANTRASMRPRSNDRGNADATAKTITDRVASMRPRSNDRGNPGHYRGFAPAGVVASMRPRSNDRGNKGDKRNDLAYHGLLQ